MIPPKKSLGQNFLINQEYLQRIACFCLGAYETDSILEIGPGIGYLTKEILLRANSKVTAIEIDARTEGYLAKLTAEYPNFNYIIGDAYEHSYAKYELVCGNLPYNVGSRIILKACKEKVNRMVFLLQAEVVDRICAATGTKAYGSLSVLLQTYYAVKSVLKVPPHVFKPQPKVESKLVVCERKSDVEIDFDLLSSLLRQAFQFPRKMLKHNLGTKVNPDIAELRPGQLSVIDYYILIQSLG